MNFGNKRKTFPGGVRLPERKDATTNQSIVSAFPSSKTLYIPVTQGGAPNSPVVKVGDSVLKGQLIAFGESERSVPVHSPVSGTVKKFDTVLSDGNKEAPCIVIAASESDEGSMFMQPLDPFSCTKEEAVKRVRDAGIVGMGGAAFPTHIKINPPPEYSVDTVIANGAECEPYLTSDERAMAENAEAVVDGLAIAMQITGAGTGIIALEDNKAFLAPDLEKAAAAHPSGKAIRVAVCNTRYPQGGERMIVSVLTGREIPSGSIPAAIGCVIFNIGTLQAVSEAFRKGKPLIERVVTLSGGACSSPKNLLAPIGALVSELVDEYSGVSDNVAEIVDGGPMMGTAMKSAAFPVVKNTSGVIFLSKKEVSVKEEGPCIGCGTCISSCPHRLNPVLMFRSIDTGKLNEAERYGLKDCVACGVCSYVCPSSIKLVQRFRLGKFLLSQEAIGA